MGYSYKIGGLNLQVDLEPRVHEKTNLRNLLFYNNLTRLLIVSSHVNLVPGRLVMETHASTFSRRIGDQANSEKLQSAMY